MENITTLPYRMKTYIGENMSSKVYSKLIRSSKRIFTSYRIIVMESLAFYIKGYEVTDVYWQYDDKTYQLSHSWKPGTIIDLKKFKLWITERLGPSLANPPNMYSLILKHICRSEISYLSMGNNHTLTRDEYLMISPTIKKVRLGKILDNDGNLISVGDILRMTPKLEEFYWNDYKGVTPHPLFFISKNSSHLPVVSNLESFNAGNISECNINEICQFIKNHFQATFGLHFISRNDYEAFKSLAKKEFQSTPYQKKNHLFIACEKPINYRDGDNKDYDAYIY